MVREQGRKSAAVCDLRHPSSCKQRSMTVVGGLSELGISPALTASEGYNTEVQNSVDMKLASTVTLILISFDFQARLAENCMLWTSLAKNRVIWKK